jgi:hypothetical protein
MTCKKTLTNQISPDILPTKFVEVIVFARFPLLKLRALPSGYTPGKLIYKKG